LLNWERQGHTGRHMIRDFVVNNLSVTMTFPPDSLLLGCQNRYEIFAIYRRHHDMC